MMNAQHGDLQSWIGERRAESGLGVCCLEAQADGVPCGCADGQCEQCQRLAEAFTRTVVSPAAGPLLDPAYG
jgi:hypothetical protein